MSGKKTKTDSVEKDDQATLADSAADTALSGADSIEAVETSEPMEDTVPAEPSEATPDPGDDTITADDADPVSTQEPANDGDAARNSEDSDALHGDDSVISDDNILTEIAETAPETPERVVERIIERRSVFVPAVFGGVLAGLLGFAAGSSDVLSSYLPSRAAAVDYSGDIDALRAQVGELQGQLSVVPAAPDFSAVETQLENRIATVTAASVDAQTALIARVDALEARLGEMALAPATGIVSEEAVAAYEKELAAARAALAQQRAEVETMIAQAAQMEADASESARQARAQAAATRLFTALDTGSGYASEVNELQSLGVTVPEALMGASGGLVSLAVLQADFPPLAREALSAAREAEGGAGGLGGFLQRQLGARSLTPREGDDPDAILSRAEAALAVGNLEQVLAELASLPEAAQAPLTDWATQAQARLSALNAAEELAQNLASN